MVKRVREAESNTSEAVTRAADEAERCRATEDKIQELNTRVNELEHRERQWQRWQEKKNQVTKFLQLVPDIQR